MTTCRYCNQTIDLDLPNDLWRGRESGKLECRAHTERGLYRFMHLPKALKEIKLKTTSMYVEVDDV